MQKSRPSRIRGQLVLAICGDIDTNGGSSDNDTKDCAAKPTKEPDSIPVTTTTPVVNWPMPSRNFCLSMGQRASVDIEAYVQAGTASVQSVHIQ